MKQENKNLPKPQNDDRDFFKQVADRLADARNFAKRQLDHTIVNTYFEIGQMIVLREQQGRERAKYGTQLIKELSEYLTEQYGRGFSIANLQNIRKFYLVYKSLFQQTTSAQLEENKALTKALDSYLPKQQTLSVKFNLSWSHYQILIRFENEDARRFYEIEAANQQWTVRQLKRQVGSSLYERVALSSDKDKLKALPSEGQSVKYARDIFKSPDILEFTGLEERSAYNESELEQALIDNLQHFLLELGKGFLFEARQKRFSFDENSFYVDLVFYNRLLQCYVIIDLKVAELKHQDLGQMMMYVNYFDRHIKRDFENPTIGILLCSQKNDNIVKLTLPENANIYASQYNLYLPDKSLLQRKLAEWIKEFEETRGDGKL